MYSPLFIALTDKDKRVLLILFLLIIVLIAFIAVCGAIITRVMKWQGKKMDDLTHDALVTDVIKDKKHFLRYARTKNWRLFVIQSWKPLTLLVLVVATLLIHNAATNNWSYDLLDYQKTGFTTLFFIWDFNDPEIYHTFFGIRLLCDWPKIISYPHLTLEAWASYIFFFGTLIGGIWYLITVQALIARTIQMYKLYYSVFTKSLDGYHKGQNQNSRTNN